MTSLLLIVSMGVLLNLHKIVPVIAVAVVAMPLLVICEKHILLSIEWMLRVRGIGSDRVIVNGDEEGRSEFRFYTF